jgi:hypothetical protein
MKEQPIKQIDEPGRVGVRFQDSFQNTVDHAGLTGW